MMYFTHNGVSSLTYGVKLMRDPDVPRAQKRAEFKTVPGRDGALVIYDDAYDDIEHELECYIEDEDNLSAVYKWLATDAEMIFSTNTARAYRAVLNGEIQTERIVRGMAARNLLIPVRFEPFRYHVPSAILPNITASGTTITNPGTYKSRPRVSIYGNGDFSVTLGGEYMEFEDVTSGIIVDSDLRECFDLDGATSANDHAIFDEYPLIPTGSGSVTFTGSISKIVVQPYWRDL